MMRGQKLVAGGITTLAKSRASKSSMARASRSATILLSVLRQRDMLVERAENMTASTMARMAAETITSMRVKPGGAFKDAMRERVMASK